MTSKRADSDTDTSQVNASGNGDTPDHPGELDKRNWKQLLKRTVKEFQDDNLTDWAAALTYYAVLALFPALLVLVAVLGVFGQQGTIDTFIESMRGAGLNSAADNIQGPLNDVVNQKGGAGALFGVGLLGAVWSASGYLGAFMRASNSIYEVEEGRPFWKLRPLQIALTIVMVLATAGVALAIVVTGPLASSIGDVVGLGGTAVTVWNIAKWPVILVVVLTMIAFL